MKKICEYVKWRLRLTPEALSRRALERVAPPVGAVALCRPNKRYEWYPQHSETIFFAGG
jgi:hypothetical protein